MPVRELMRWVPSQRRWRRMYKGKQYYISARQLGCAETKEESREAANRWWEQKRAEVDLASRPERRTSQGPLEDVLAALVGGKPWTSQEDVAAGAIGYLESLPPSPAAETLAGDIELAAFAESDHGDTDAWERVAAALGKRLLPALLERIVLRGEPLSEPLRERLPPARVVQIETGVKSVRGEQTAEPERTVKPLADAWSDKQQAMVQVGEMTAARAYNVAGCLRHFVAFLGETADAAIIDAERLEAFHHFCLKKIADGKWSTAFTREVFSAARRWIKWLWERGEIELPKNLNSRWRFGSVVSEIETMTVDEVRFIIDKAKGKLKLALMLMANAGFTQKDVSDLADDEVDWNEGRVIRRRSKTRKHKNAPTVGYPLWPCTLALLKEYRSGQERVLLTSTGKAYVRKMDGGDMFSTVYDRLRKQTGFKKQMKLLRKTSASLLENHTVQLPSGDTINPFAGCVSLFLGHAPASMAAKHYAAPPQKLFDEAVLWLGKQYGFVDGP